MDNNETNREMKEEFEYKPYKCPVCCGNGLVPNGFYNQTNGTWTTTYIAPEKCRSCDGLGVIWSKQDLKPIER